MPSAHDAQRTSILLYLKAQVVLAVAVDHFQSMDVLRDERDA